MKEEAKKGFSYTVSDEQLDEYRKWSLSANSGGFMR